MISVQIAIEVFPNLRELDIIIDSHDCIVLLNQFAHLSRLRIKWIPRFEVGDYSRALQVILCEVRKKTVTELPFLFSQNLVF